MDIGPTFQNEFKKSIDEVDDAVEEVQEEGSTLGSTGSVTPTPVVP